MLENNSAECTVGNEEQVSDAKAVAQTLKTSRRLVSVQKNWRIMLPRCEFARRHKRCYQTGIKLPAYELLRCNLPCSRTAVYDCSVIREGAHTVDIGCCTTTFLDAGETQLFLSVDEPLSVGSLGTASRHLEKMVNCLVPTLLSGDSSFLFSFLGNYRGFGTMQQALDLLFTRYGCILPYSSEDGWPQDHVKKAMSIILGTWMEQYWRDFWQPPDFPSLQLVLAYVQLSMPGSSLEHHARFLLAQLQDLEPSEAEPEALSPAPGTTEEEAAPASACEQGSLSEPVPEQDAISVLALEPDGASVPPPGVEPAIPQTPGPEAPPAPGPSVEPSQPVPGATETPLLQQKQPLWLRFLTWWQDGAR